MEHKTSKAVVLNAEEVSGIVECIFSVFGVLDFGNDITHNGSFSKTWNERGNKIKLLDSHNTNSVLSALGKPLEFRELKREQLPPQILSEYPEATGGAWAKVQFNMKTDARRDAFWHVASGDVDEWSWGYDPVDKDYSKVNWRGNEVVARNLRTIKQYELSPVIFGMNPATTTTSAKSQPTEGKPYRAIREGGRWNVYKIDAGVTVGESLGDHDSEEEANRQVAALYASEDDRGANPEGKAGRVLNSRIAKQIQMAMENLHEVLKAAGLVMEDEAEEAEEAPYDEMMTSGPQKSAEPPTSNEAGPDADNSTRLLKLIEIEIEEMEAK